MHLFSYESIKAQIKNNLKSFLLKMYKINDAKAE